MLSLAKICLRLDETVIKVDVDQIALTLSMKRGKKGLAQIGFCRILKNERTNQQRGSSERKRRNRAQRSATFHLSTKRSICVKMSSSKSTTPSAQSILVPGECNLPILPKKWLKSSTVTEVLLKKRKAKDAEATDKKEKNAALRKVRINLCQILSPSKIESKLFKPNPIQNFHFEKLFKMIKI